MFKWILEHLKIIAIVAIVVSLWVTLSAIMNAYIPWDYLTDIFKIGRWAFAAMDWINDSTTMFWAIGLSLILEAAEWAFETGLITVRWFDTSKTISMPKNKSFLDNYED